MSCFFIPVKFLEYFPIISIIYETFVVFIEL